MNSHPLLSRLNTKQREAVVSEHKRLLVLAGAGSGKTRTLIQKALYLISERNIDPSNILAITFTRNAANEMIDRLILASDKDGEYKKILENKGVARKVKEYGRRDHIKKYPWLSNITVKTFHALCHHVMRNYGAKEFDNKFKMLREPSYDDYYGRGAKETPEQIIHKLILNKCEDPEYLMSLKRYILDFYVDEFRVKMHKLGHADYKNPYTTLKGDHVKSKSERDIADWLYRHRIEYFYEPETALVSFECRPDFYINEADIYLELVSSRSYPLSDKEKEMKQAGKNYFKIYEQETHNSSDFNKIMDEVIVSHLDRDFRKVSPLNVLEEFKGYDKHLRQFILDIIRVIDKIKVENKNFNEIYLKALDDPHRRVRDFYEFFKPLFEDYNCYCVNCSYLDFNDLLIKTITLFKNHEEVRKIFRDKFKYILVDEFQDVNTLQVILLNQLLKEDNQLFCVGDDWQSIYGFRGSELDYIVNFETYFENPGIIKLDINYRSSDTIVDASNEVISRNRHKIDKEVRSFSKTGKKIYLYCAEKEEKDGVEMVFKNIKKLLKNGYSRDDILVLTRTTKSDAYPVYERKLGTLGIKVTTIHKAKGLEAKIVFIIGLTQGYGGFPNVRDADRIFQMIKKSNFELLMEEERRVFYVALTRAKEELFLISEVGNESEFIKEIPGEFLDRNNFLILALKSTQKICKHCGEEIEEVFNYCPYCGKYISESLADLNCEETPNPEIIEPDIHSIENIVKELCLSNPNKIASIEDIKEKAGEMMIDKGKIDKILDELKDGGVLFEPRKGYWKLVK